MSQRGCMPKKVWSCLPSGTLGHIPPPPRELRHGYPRYPIRIQFKFKTFHLCRAPYILKNHEHVFIRSKKKLQKMEKCLHFQKKDRKDPFIRPWSTCSQSRYLVFLIFLFFLKNPKIFENVIFRKLLKFLWKSKNHVFENFSKFWKFSKKNKKIEISTLTNYNFRSTQRIFLIFFYGSK